MKEKKEFSLLSKGIFSKPLMDSRVKTRAVSKKEKIFGHLLGPLGLIFIVNTVAALVEKFFTQQTGAMYGTENAEMIKAMGGYYGTIMMVAKIFAIAFGLLNGFLIEKTKSKQGRMRPWYLIFGFVSIIIGAVIFLFPGTTLGESYWYYFFILLIAYHTIGSTFFYLFRDNIVSLSTRNSVEKTQLSFIRKVSWTLISGIIIGMILNMVVLPFWLEKNINGYAILMIILSIVALPLLLLEYFYTRERVSEDVSEEKGEKNTIPLKAQIKALFTNKNFVIITILMTIIGVVDSFKGGNVQFFYIKHMLGGAENPLMYTIYQVVTGVPLGVGAFAIYPLVRKMGIKNLTISGYVLVLIGSVIGWVFPDQLVPALLGGFLRQLGMLPTAYIFITLFYYAFDDIEFKSGLRLEGLLGMAIVVMIQSAIYAPFSGGYESMVLKLGFIDVEGVIPNTDVKNFMTMSFYLFDIILASAFLIFLPFYDAEKRMKEISLELLYRKKNAVLAAGKEWVEPEEEARREKEKAAIELEENRIEDLKIYCAKKGIDFDVENQKYLNKKAVKEAKAAEKEAKKLQKQEAKKAKKAGHKKE